MFSVAPKISPNFIPKDITVKKGEEFKIAIPYDGNPIPKADWSVVRIYLYNIARYRVVKFSLFSRFDYALYIKYNRDIEE